MLIICADTTLRLVYFPFRMASLYAAPSRKLRSTTLQTSDDSLLDKSMKNGVSSPIGSSVTSIYLNGHITPDSHLSTYMRPD
jgi:hypothetical protein